MIPSAFLSFMLSYENAIWSSGGMLLAILILKGVSTTALGYIYLTAKYSCMEGTV